ncbi:MAG: hypothetical protein AAGA92_05835 [Planctomycetota bacterium]
MPGTSVSRKVYRRLMSAYGPQGWWSATSAWEVMVGAVLVQNTSWRNAERATDDLLQADRLRFERMRLLNRIQLAKQIRRAGLYRIKAERLRGLIDIVDQRFGGSVDAMGEIETPTLRSTLLDTKGIGPETADSILCYAFDRPVIVADAYAHRVYARHGWATPRFRYAAVQERMAEGLPGEPLVCNELHALLVRVGREHCGKPAPRCEGCPLADLLPAGGPLAI